MKNRAAHQEAIAARCPTCDGWGFERGRAAFALCNSCGGSGRATHKQKDLANG